MKGRDPLESLVEEIQKQILEEESLLYSSIVLEEVRSPYHMYEMTDAHGTARFTGVCGDTMWVYLKVDGGRVVEASFVTDGCGATVAVGSRMMRMVEGKGLSEVLMMTDDDLIDELGGLPPENLHCATLAVTTLYKAVDDLYAKGVVG